MQARKLFGGQTRASTVVLVAALAVTLISLADVLAPNAVLVAVFPLGIIGVTAAYLRGKA